jgi:hypothetical protein
VKRPLPLLSESCTAGGLAAYGGGSLRGMRHCMGDRIDRTGSKGGGARVSVDATVRQNHSWACRDHCVINHMKTVRVSPSIVTFQRVQRYYTSSKPTTQTAVYCFGGAGSFWNMRLPQLQRSNSGFRSFRTSNRFQLSPQPTARPSLARPGRNRRAGTVLAVLGGCTFTPSTPPAVYFGASAAALLAYVGYWGVLQKKLPR